MAEFKSFSVNIDDKTFTRESKKLLKDLGSEGMSFVREQSALLARTLAQFTPPYAKSPDDKKNTVGTPADIKTGMNAVKYAILPDPAKSETVSVLFQVRRKRSYINYLIKTFGRGPIIENGEQIAGGVLDDLKSVAQWHYNNRITRGTNPGRIRRLKKIEKPFVHRALLNKYAKRRMKDVGIAKASFYKASLNLGAKAVAPPAVKNNVMKATGSGRLKKTKEGYEGIISASAKGIFHVIHRLPKIEKNRNEKAQKRLRIIARELAKKTKLNDR